MWNIGIDVHKTRCWLVAKTTTGQVMARKSFRHTREAWQKTFEDIPTGSHVAIECVGWYHHIIELLEELGMEPVVAHARKVELIAKSRSKTDRNDAEILCDLLRTEFLPEAYVPTPEARRIRELSRYLDDVVKQTTRVKNQVHRLLERAWVTTPDVSDLFGKKGRQWLSSVEVEPVKRLQLDCLLAQLDLLTGQQEDLLDALCFLVQDDGDVELVLSLTGVNLRGAVTLRGEIDDVSRFANRKKIRSNFGLAVTVRDSGGKEKRGRITKQGSSLVRKFLGQGAIHFVRGDERRQAKFKRLREERGFGTANTAAAADLLTTTYAVLKSGEPYSRVRHGLWQRKKQELARRARKGEQLLLS